MTLAMSSFGGQGMSVFVPQPHSAFRSPTLQPRPEPARLACSPLVLPQPVLPFISDFTTPPQQQAFFQSPVTPQDLSNQSYQAPGSTVAAAVVPSFGHDAPCIGHVLPQKMPFDFSQDFSSSDFPLEPLSSTVVSREGLLPELSLLDRIRTYPPLSQSHASNLTLPTQAPATQQQQMESNRVAQPAITQEPLSPRIEGKLAKYRASIPALVVPEPAVPPKPSVRLAPHETPCDEDMLYTLFLDEEEELSDSIWQVVPSTPVPVGRMWSTLSRYPALEEYCIAQLGHIDDVRSSVLEALEKHLAHDSAFASLAPVLMDRIRRRFEQLHVDATQLFLERAQAQGTIGKRAARASSSSMQTVWRSPPPALKTEDAATLVKVTPQPSSSPELAQFQVAGLTCPVSPATRHSKHAQTVTPMRTLDSEADAEVASMATPSSVTSDSVGPVTSASSSVATQRMTAKDSSGRTSRASTPLLAAMTEARRRREEIHSCPALSFTEKMRLLVITPIKEEEEEGKEKGPHPVMGRSQSVQHRPPSSFRRRLNFDKPLSHVSVKPPRRSMTPSASSSSAYLRMLAKNAPLEAWLLAHLHDPFPSVTEKMKLSEESGLSFDQVSHWFINARGRKLKPLLAEREAQAAVVAATAATMRTDGGTDTSPRSAADSAIASARGAHVTESSGAKKAKVVHDPTAQLAEWSSNDGAAAVQVPAAAVPGKAKRNKKRRHN